MTSLHEHLRRFARKGLACLLVLIAAALLVVVPAWRGAGAISVVSALRGAADPANPPSEGEGQSEEEEETTERAALSRSDIEIHRTAARREQRATPAVSLLRHRMERDAAASALRWASYRAPPRAPPHRLLN